jgi:hypothetical protein
MAAAGTGPLDKIDRLQAAYDDQPGADFHWSLLCFARWARGPRTACGLSSSPNMVDPRARKKLCCHCLGVA